MILGIKLLSNLIAKEIRNIGDKMEKLESSEILVGGGGGGVGTPNFFSLIFLLV